MTDQKEYPIQINKFSFAYANTTNNIIHNLTWKLEKGSRCLLVGENGAGKSTLLRILAGKHMHPRNDVLVLGRSAFYETPAKMNYLGSEWRRSVGYVSNSVSYHCDISVEEMLRPLPKDQARYKQLLDLLDVDVNWRMHKISDGQTRRVQIVMGLMLSYDVLLLDEITVDLDVLSRIKLLEFLKLESERGCTIIYATHIFDGVENWATHVAHMGGGNLEVVKSNDIKVAIYLQVYNWLLEDKEMRKKKKEEEGNTN